MLDESSVGSAPEAQEAQDILHNAGPRVTNNAPEDEILDAGNVLDEEGPTKEGVNQTQEAATGGPHLELQVDISGMLVPEEELTQEEAVGINQGVEDAIQEFLEDCEEV